MPQHPHAHIGVPARSQEDETRTQEHAAAAGETVFRTSKECGDWLGCSPALRGFAGRRWASTGGPGQSVTGSGNAPCVVRTLSFFFSVNCLQMWPGGRVWMGIGAARRAQRVGRDWTYLATNLPACRPACRVLHDACCLVTRACYHAWRGFFSWGRKMASSYRSVKRLTALTTG